ncbi:MAG: tandem-95 repeat protein [Pirellulaceae bacterium]|nr:tandem-95 repeat protein [Pirellulaceae bacterium]
MPRRSAAALAVRPAERRLRKQAQAAATLENRRLLLETLEDRRLMAVGPQLVTIRTSGGAFLNDGDSRNDALVDLTFRFNEGQAIDPATLGAVRLTRSGFDGIFGDPVDGFGDDVVLQPGFLGLGDVPNEVVMRFATPLPDDAYRIDIIGSGTQPLRNTDGEAFNDGVDEQIDFELDLGAQVVAIVPQPMARVGALLTQQRNRIDVYFNDDDLFVEYDGMGNPTARSAEHPAFYQLILTRDTVSNTDDVLFLPQSVSYDPAADRATLIFASDLEDLEVSPGVPVGQGTFRLKVGVSQGLPSPPLRIAPGVDVTSDFNTGGAVEVRFVGDPLQVERFGTATRIVVTKSDHGAAGLPIVSVVDNQIRINLNTRAGSVSTAADLVAAIAGHPEASELVTAVIASGNPAADITTPAIDYSPLVLVGHGTSVDTATDLGTIDASGALVSARIDAQLNRLDFPGASDEPGHRDIPGDVGSGYDQHINALFGADRDLGVTTVLYNFKPNYGTSVSGDPLTNLITENQKQAARQALSVWGDRLGVQFLETATQGLTIVTGDPSALNPNAADVVNHALDFTNPDLNFIVRTDPNFARGMLILDSAHQWDDTLGGEWFRTAMIGVGFMLGLERAEDLPESTVMSYVNSYIYPGSPPAEAVLLDNHDVVHGQYLYRPDSNDIDLYRFQVDLGDAGLMEKRTGLLTLETIAERQANASTLNSHLALYEEVEVLDEHGMVVRREPRLIARNDDYFSEDSYIQVEVGSGVYFVGVSASGNGDYDPIQEDTGFGGASQGVYDLRIGVRPQDDGDRVIRDLDRINEGVPGTPLDGDADGTPGGAFNFWFRVVDTPDTIYVDKAHVTNNALPRGTLANPWDELDNALAVAQPGQVVRLVANGGLDGNLGTLADNFAYEIGFGTLPGQQLEDGTTMAVPRGVTVMIDPGAVFKLRQARIGVGSSSLGVDRSNGALQVLGTPSRPVYFTSWLDETIGLDTHLPTTQPAAGDWGGIVVRADLDNAEGRFSYEDQGIYLNYVNQADLRYGGGRVTIDSVQQVVNPIQLIETQPTVSFNRITFSADAAMSADPNSFEEVNFHGPRHQQQGLFTADYTRIGPDIHGNRLSNNSTNGLFIRITTPAGSQLRRLTVPGRFNDTDIVHVLAENLQVQGAAGGRQLDTSRPPSSLVTSQPQAGGTLAVGTYNYKLVFLDDRGFQGRPSLPTSNVTLAGAQGQVRLDNLPPVTSGFRYKQIYRSQAGGQGPYVLVGQVSSATTTFTDNGTRNGPVLERDPLDSRGIGLAAVAGGSLPAGTYNYRLVNVDLAGVEGPASDRTSNLVLAAAGSISVTNLPPAAAGFVGRRLYRSTAQADGPYTLVAELDAATASFLDNGSDLGERLDPASYGVVRSRGQARLAIDPGTIVKLEGARIEARFGAQVLIEGINGSSVIMTSKLDDRYGAGGTFDTNNDGTLARPAPGDWGGIYVGPLGTASIDYSLLAFGGGINRIEGTFTAFNMIEVHEGDLRLANSVLENAAPGVGGLAPADRFGRGTNLPATIFVRGAQPVIKDNLIRDNAATALTINANSFTHIVQPDPGRSTGFIGDQPRFDQNQGPLVRGNMFVNNPLNGMVIRGETLTTESVWDDTSTVHVLFDQVVVPNFHTYGGLRLQSSTTDRLVVKLFGPGDNFDGSVGAGFTVSGRPLEINDRIGGILHIVGEPDFPVVITSLSDDTVGAGFRPDGSVQTDTNNDGIASVPSAGNWRSIRLDQFSHDRNVEVALEREAPGVANTGENNRPDRAQYLGELAASETGGDDNLRLGFEIRGLLQSKNDVDVYSFDATAGTEVWFDIDRTTRPLDTVIELIDTAGNVVARTDNSLDEAADPSLLFRSAGIPAQHVNPLTKVAPEFQPRHVSGLAKDFFSLNELDAGMRLILPGVAGTRSTYHVRVRSSSPDLNELEGGLTAGVYVMQIRLRETDELAGSTIRYADVRYATNGIELYGMPGHSPLLGEAAEDEEIGGPETNNHIIWNQFVPGSGAQDLGNLLNADRGATSIAGTIATLDDVDFFEFQVNYDAIGPSVHTFEHFPAVFDIDYADGLSRPNTNIVVFDEFGRPVLIGRDSNIADDRLVPLADGDLSDLSTGSIGVLDPYIGPVMLPEGTYFVAVVSNARLPRQLLQNPITRVEPVNSVTRIVEDHIGSFGGSTAAPPEVPVLLDNSSIIPMDPEDVTLFVIQDLEDDDDLATLTALDPFTGAIKWTVGDYEGQVFDIATRLDGNVFGLSAPDTDIDDASAGLLQGVNTSAEQFVGSRDTLIATYHQDPLNPGIAVPSDVGMLFHAMTYGDLGDGIERLFAVGSRGDAFDPMNPRPTGPSYFTNILYHIDPRTGQALSAPQADRVGNARFQGAGTQIVERGFLDTNVGGGPGGIVAGLAVLNNVLYALSDTGGLFVVNNPLSNTASLTYIGDVVDNSGMVSEIEPNNDVIEPSADLTLAQDLDREVWTQRFSPDIGDRFTNTSTDIKHITIEGSGDDGFVDFFPELNFDLDDPRGMTIGPDGNLYVASFATNQILRFNGTTGEFIDVFVGAGLDGPMVPLFGGDVNFDGVPELYVTSFNSDSVIRYDGATGLSLGTFVLPASGGLDGPTDMVFRGGDLYVASSLNDRVLRYDGTFGTSLGVYIGAALGGLDDPQGIAFDGMGNLYVNSRGANAVFVYDNQPVPALLTTLTDPLLLQPGLGLRFSPGGGSLYVSSTGADSVLRYDFGLMVFTPYVIPGAGGLDGPEDIVFVNGNTQMLVSSSLDDKILLYDRGIFAATFDRTFVPFGTGGLNDPRDMVIGPDGLLYISSWQSDSVVRYIPETKTFDTVFVTSGSGGLNGPHGLTFGPDQSGDGQPDLYVASQLSNEILVYNGVTGAHIRDFVTLGLDLPTGIAFGPDATADGVPELYVANFLSDNVMRYNGVTGNFVSQFIPTGSGGLDQPIGIQFRPDGLLYVASSGAMSNNILRYRANTGVFFDAFLQANPRLQGPAHFVFAADGNVYVTSFNNNAIMRYDAVNGTFIDDFSPAGLPMMPGNEGLFRPVGILQGADGLLYVASSASDEIFRFDTAGTPTYDYYHFSVEEDGSLAIFDIDFGDDGNPGSFNSMLILLDDGGGVVDFNDDFSPTAGAGGSVSRNDAYLEAILDEGEYYLVVAEALTVEDELATGNRPDLSDTYTLHISVENWDGRAFAGLARRPRFSDVDPFTDTLLSIDTLGDIYSFGTDAVGKPFFSNGQSIISTGVLDAFGLSLSATLWHITEQRHSDLGHGLSTVFDDSRGNARDVQEIEPNDTVPLAHDLEEEFWTLRYDANLGDNSDPVVNTSIFYPHITVQGSGDGTHDFYSFQVTQPNAVGLFEIDMSHDHQLSVNGFLDDDPFQFMDAELTLFDSLGNALAFNRYPANPTDGDAGNDFLAVHPFVDPPPIEPFIRFVFPTPGTYILQVTKRTATQTGVAPDVGDFYTLQVSVEGHTLDGPPVDGGQSFFFGTELGGDVQNATAGTVQITSIAHGLLGGERVYVEGVMGIDGANGTFEVDMVSEDVFELIDSDATGTYLGGGTWRMLRTPEDINGKLLSNPFSLRGYSPEDKPTLYFNYLLDASGNPLIDIAQVSLVQEDGTTTPLAVKNTELNPVPATILTLAEDIVEIVWRQARVELDDFAGLENMRLLFEFDAADQVATDLEGFFIDDIIIGFAERGEMISHAYNDPVFVANPELTVEEIVIGNYQLEIRQATDFGRSSLLIPDTSEIASLHLEQSYDTNDRHAGQFTMLVPPGSAINDTDTFTLYDGINTVVFEFDTGNGVAEGNAQILFQPADPDDVVARQIRDAINASSVQSILAITAGLSDGTNEGVRGNDNRLNLYGNAVITGTSIPVVAHSGQGDGNLFRDQGQLLVHSNFITDARDWGIKADAGQRNRETGLDVGFLQPSPGPVRRLQELNNAPAGGLAPGATIENNVIAGAGLGGIHFSGNEAPWEIIPFQPTPALPTSGDRSCDGVTFQIRSGRTTVTFELEDLSGSPIGQCGSGVMGGNGWTPGNVPVFFRRTGNYPTPLGPRGPGYDQYEMVLAIRDAINGSILVTNGTTETVRATVGMSRGIGGPFLPDDIRIYGAWPALYLENVSFVTLNPSRGFISRQVPLAAAPQPFGRIINNTIYGSDGTESFFAGSGLSEPNDTIFEAVNTYQGRAQNPEVYSTTATIGDNLDTPFDRSMDVDFYKIHLDIYDRVTVDVDANELGGRLNSVIRLFNALGEEVASSDNDPAPGETRSLDSYLDFTATEAGTYYVGISGALNDQYSAISLGNREGESSRGDYDLEINVWAPRQWVIQAVDGTLIPDGATIQVKDVSGAVVTYEFDIGNGVAGTNVPILFDPSPIPNSGNRGPGYRAPEVAVAAASVIGNGLTGVTATPLGGHRGGSIYGPVAGRPTQFFILPVPDRRIDPDMEGFSHDHHFTAPISTTELYIVIEGAANVTSSFLQMTPTPTSNVDSLLLETGILVSENASPTLLNNILANLESGILQMDSPTTIVGASLYQHNLNTNSNVGSTNEDFSIPLGNLEPLFVDAADGNFYLAARSRAIDSAVDTLEDRAGLVTVKDPMGLAVSPILAPDRDASGQLRTDDPDVAPPLGLGANVFKDRGAVDRADFVGPAAVLVEPLDNDTEGIDLDPTETIVQLSAGDLNNFRIQLVDGATQGDGGAGIGVDDSSVTSEKISITEDGVLLQPGVDYNFRYDATTNVISLAHVTGIWPNNRTYVIRLNNTDRFVIDAPRGDQVVDGQTFFIEDRNNNVVTFEYESGFSIRVPQPLSLQVPPQGVGPGGITDGQTLIVAPPLGAAVTFEFDTNSPPNVFSGNLGIDVSSATSVDDVANAIVTAITNAALGLRPANLGGGVVHLGARRGYFVDTTPTVVSQFGFAGVFVDGETFTVSEGANSVTFEFNETILNPNVMPGNTRIEFDNTFTQDQLVDVVGAAIAAAGLNLSPVNLGNGLLHVGGTVAHDIQIPMTSLMMLAGQPGVLPGTTLELPGPVALLIPAIGAQPGGIEDGQTFIIDDGMSTVVVFEFENTLIGDGVTGMNTVVPFTPNDSIDTLADTLADIIGMAGLNLSPANVGGGVVELAATIDHVIDPDRSTLEVIGRVDGVEDQEIFTISRAGAPPVVFEFDNDNMTTPGNRVIRFTDTTTDDELIDAMIAAIQAGGLALNPIKISSQSLRLNDTAAYATDVSGSSLIKTGVAGGSVAVPFVPDASFTEVDFAQPIIEAIVTSPLQGVRLNERGAASFFVENANAISGDVPSFFARAIRDLAGNLLLPNQATSQTQFIIVMPNVELDFGDAAAPYATTFAQDGPRHSIASNNVFLGASVDADADGQPTMGADGDDNDTDGNDDDGVSFDGIFNRFLVTPITVNASATGLLDAWIDFNQDGDFDDFAEQVFRGVRLFAGDNPLSISTPSFVQSPGILSTVARFRFSSSGGTSPTGLAPDGEVEDYLIQILPGTPPVADNDFYSTDENTALNVPAPGVLVNDTDAELQPLSVFDFDATSQLGATVTVAANGGFQYDPASIPAIQSLAQGDLVLDTFTYRATDGVLPSNVATVSIAVSGVNDAPTATDLSASATEDGPQVVAAFDGDDIDIDDNQGSLQYTILTAPSEGSVINNGDGTFTFDPSGAFQDLAAGETRVVTFDYQATDRHAADSNVATVTITVTGVNDRPTVADVALGAVEDGPAVDGAFVGDDADSNDSPGSLIYTLTSLPPEGSATNNNDGTFTFDPDTDFQDLSQGQTRVVSFNYTATDSLASVSLPGTVNVTVTGVNDVPTTTDVLINAFENGPGVLGNFGGDDVDSENNPSNLLYMLLNQPSEGSVVNNGNGTFTFSPGADFQDLAQGEIRFVSFDYRATDARGAVSNDSTVTIRVTGVNDAPVASGVMISAMEDGPVVTGAFAGDDIDSDDNPSTLAYIITSTPSEGTVNNNFNGTFRFDPGTGFQDLALGQTRTVSFNYVAIDSRSASSAPGTVMVVVTGVNDNPTAATVLATAREDGPQVIAQFAGNDIDNDDNQATLIYSILSMPSEGSATNNGNGTFTFDPEDDFQDLALGASRVVSFSYRATDRHGAVSVLGSVNVTVTGVNDAPIANDVAAGAMEDGPPVVVPFDADDIDGDDSRTTLSYALLSTPSEGSITQVSGGNFTFNPGSAFQNLAAGETRVVSFDYRATDRHGASDTATARITVTGVNDVPVAVANSYMVNQLTVLNVPAAGLLANDSDADASDSIRVVRLGSTGGLVGTSTLGANVTLMADGSFSYDPTVSATLFAIPRGSTRLDTFTYVIADNQNAEATATVSVTVQGVNKPPQLVDDSYQTLEDTIISQPAITGVLNNDRDPDGDPLAVVAFQNPSTLGATVTVASNGSFTYNPTTSLTLQMLGLGDTIEDTFTVTVSDGQGAQVMSTVRVLVEGLNENPVAVNDMASTPRNTAVLIDILANDSDLDGTLVPGSITLLMTPQNGIAVPDGTGRMIYSPNAGFRGTDTFRYTVQDDDGGVSNIALVTILVNDPPVAVDDEAAAIINATVAIDVLSNDSDADGALNPATVAVVAQPQHGVATANPDGTVSYMPNLDYSGPDSFTYRVRDDSGTLSNVATVTLDVSDNPFPWQNTRLRYDVNDDGLVTAVDPLIVINRINSSGAGPLPVPSPGTSPPPYYDVVPDNFVAPSDVNAVINYINTFGSGEGESAGGGTLASRGAAVSGEEAASTLDRYQLIVEGRAPVLDPALFRPAAASRRAATTSQQPLDAVARMAPAPQPSRDLLSTLAQARTSGGAAEHLFDLALEELLQEKEQGDL